MCFKFYKRGFAVRIAAAVCGAVLCGCQTEEYLQWPEANSMNKPGVRWWWMGSAVDSVNLKALIEEYSEKGIGAVEITPIYGVQGNEANEIPFLSEGWMDMLASLTRAGRQHGVQIDMNCGTGWPFGGPHITEHTAARKFVCDVYYYPANAKSGKRQAKAGGTNKGGARAKNPKNNSDDMPTALNPWPLPEILSPADPKQKNAPLMKLMAFADDDPTQFVDLTAGVTPEGKITQLPPKDRQWKVYAVYCGHTFQKVKRAAPGGEGLVVDHFDKRAVETYLTAFDSAFKGREDILPATFFNDSYEVYYADCTPEIFKEFEARRGYKLEEHLPALFAEKSGAPNKVITDYNETLSDLLLENFTETWRKWAHQKGVKIRNQAHGSPANLIDLYAAIDIPECEGFGLSDFGIKGLRRDSMVRKNDSDLSMLKWASSGAHITGHTYTSSETFTWLTEHFRTSFSQCKPDMDLMFVAGVNRMMFHGTTYSPLDDPWPGWKFYASMDMSPTNPLWRDAKGFTTYISRVQGMLQLGKPDNDFLIYLPIHDIWDDGGNRLLQLTIHAMAHRAPRFIETINAIDRAGYDVDYISDRYLLKTEAQPDGCLSVRSARDMATRYKAIILPDVKNIPASSVEHLKELAKANVNIVIIGNDPVPELSGDNIIRSDSYAEALAKTGAEPEAVRFAHGLKAIRRQTAQGTLYFVSNLTPNDVDNMVALNGIATPFVLMYDAVSGRIGRPQMSIEDGKQSIRLQLKSGESVIVREIKNPGAQGVDWVYRGDALKTIDLTPNHWKLSFADCVVSCVPGAQPQAPRPAEFDTLRAWSALPDSTYRIAMGTGTYETVFNLDATDGEWWLDLGDVRETARIWVNGKETALLWCVPYVCNVTDYLKSGTNKLRIDVTNLPANQIAHLDRMGVKWRKFKDTNVVDRNYKRTTYAKWLTVESGLNSTVKLINSK